MAMAVLIPTLNVPEETTNPSFDYLSQKWHLSQPIAEELRAIQEFVLDRWKLSPTHSISHWNRVFDNGMKLCVNGVDPIVVQYFAYLHDSCRNDDWEDIQHGERAADWLPSIRSKYLKNLSEEQFTKLQIACRLHTTTHRTGDPTIDACFDADRLDLWRCDIKPEPSKMATPKGAELAGQITYEMMAALLDSYYMSFS